MVEDFSPFFPDDEDARERLGAALKKLLGEPYAERMWKHDALRKRAEQGDADAALAYTREARDELVLALEEQGDDASVFKHDHWTYGPFRPR